MFSWTIINDVTRGTANPTGVVGTASIVMSPVVTEVALVLKTSGGRVAQSRQVAVGTGIGGTVLMIVTEQMALKTFCQGASWCWAKSTRMRKYTSGRGEYTSAIRKVNMLGSIPGDRESIVFIIH